MRPQSLRPRSLSVLTLVFALTAGAAAQAPPGYYDSVDESSAATLRATLHAVIDDHQRFPYTSGATDTWDVLELADEDPCNSANIRDVYRNASYAKVGGGNSNYNREHTWPNSYGFPDDNSGNYPYTDCHQLFLCDSSYNSSRSNKPFRECSASCSEKTTGAGCGNGGGVGSYPGNSNWTSGSFTSGSWEVWHDRRGDIARALFYLDLRYEGGIHGVTLASEPDLVLTDSESLIAGSNTGSNEAVAYMGMLSVLLEWHAEDPVDAKEMHRNDVVYGFQGNRNPFIDHPEWAGCLFAGDCTGLFLQGPAALEPGEPLTLTWSSAFPGEPYWLYWSKQLNGSVIQGTPFDVGPQVFLLATGSTRPDGGGRWSSFAAVPVRAAGAPGRTLYFELRVDSAGQTWSSNPVAVELP